MMTTALVEICVNCEHVDIHTYIQKVSFYNIEAQSDWVSVFDPVTTACPGHLVFYVTGLTATFQLFQGKLLNGEFFLFFLKFKMA